MAFVSVPKDLTKVKNKIIFNLTKRQLICFGIAAAVGVPFYFLTRGIIGSSKAKTSVNTSDAVYNAWYDAVYEPQQTAVEPEPDTGTDEVANG